MKKCSWVALLFFTGCAVGPNYKAPENTVADTWAFECALVSKESPVVEWWDLFEDPLLSKYIAVATLHNQDVLTATSNVLAARALRQMTASSFFPQIGADVNATKTYFSKNGPIFASEPSVGQIPGTISPATGFPFDLQFPQKQSLYNALLDASWEIDLFGKTRRSVEAANANIGKVIEQRNDVLLSIMAEIASNYMELRSFQTRENLIKENIALLMEEAALVQAQFKKGYVSEVDNQNILALLASERAELPNIQAQIYRSIYALSVLTGDVPESLTKELLPFQPLPKIPEVVSVGLKSDLLRRRPDVRSAERDLAIATANIGVAVASFFPTINLLGDGGFQSLNIKNLFTALSKTWAIGGDINMPIFQGGLLVGNLRAKRAETAATAHTYQQTVLTALEEAEGSLISYTHDLKSVLEKKEAISFYRNLVFLSKERHVKGLVNALDLIDSEITLNESLQSLLESETTTLLDLVSLYKALGGGWEAEFSKD